MAKTYTYQKPQTQVDGRIQVNYLIQDESRNVKIVGLLLPPSTDVDTYVQSNIDSLFDVGIDFPEDEALVSPVAVFEAIKSGNARPIHLSAIFLAFEQLSGGGDISDMNVAARSAYTDNAEQDARLSAFITEYKRSSQVDKDELAAIAIFAVASLITSQ